MRGGRPLIVEFSKTGAVEHVARVGDTEVRFCYDDHAWSLESFRYDKEIGCSHYWHCDKHDCSLEDVADDDLADDGYCIGCPKKIEEVEVENSMTNHKWPEVQGGLSLEDARKLLMKHYAGVFRISFNNQNKGFRDILFGTWVLKT